MNVSTGHGNFGQLGYYGVEVGKQVMGMVDWHFPIFELGLTVRRMGPMVSLKLGFVSAHVARTPKNLR